MKHLYNRTGAAEAIEVSDINSYEFTLDGEPVIVEMVRMDRTPSVRDKRDFFGVYEDVEVRLVVRRRPFQTREKLRGGE